MVTFEGFQLMEIDINERCGRQHNCEDHEPEPVLAAPELLSLQLHSNLPRALRHTDENIA
jgi:hypothetical protein